VKNENLLGENGENLNLGLQQTTKKFLINSPTTLSLFEFTHLLSLKKKEENSRLFLESIK
jgi:hypothetical protein